jgi:inner membrane transporter RhtA
VLSVQLGAAAATTLFDEIGPAGSVLYRLFFSALVLSAIWRPRPGRFDRRALGLAALFGATVAAMNLFFYESLDRIPLGVAVTLEFVGPLAVALLSSRRALDLLWVGLAAAGILLLTRPSGDLDTTGIALALTAGGFWAVYILVGARIGRAFPGGTGLALAMGVGAVLMLPPGIAAGGSELLDARVAGIGFAVALLSSAIPYSFEIEALRRLAVGTFGVLMSLEPAVAALVGLVALGQDLATVEVVGIGLVIAASAGALREPGAPAPREA